MTAERLTTEKMISGLVNNRQVNCGQVKDGQLIAEKLTAGS